MSDEKIYIGTGKILAGKNGYADRLKLSFPADDLRKMLEWAEGQGGRGWCNVIVAERKSASKTGMTHYCTLDTWQPAANRQDAQQAAQPPAGVVSGQAGWETGVDGDQMPF
jgi:hypothetical protein